MKCTRCGGLVGGVRICSICNLEEMNTTVYAVFSKEDGGFLVYGTEKADVDGFDEERFKVVALHSNDLRKLIQDKKQG